jgi:hypothetical protein
MNARDGDTFVGRRLVGVGLALYGALSLILILILLALVIAPPRDGDDGLLGLDAQRRQLLGVIDASATAIENAETAARGVDDTLLSTGSAAASAAVLMNELATTMRELAASLRISILGSQPFAGPADQFDLVAGQAGRVAADLDLAAASIRLGAADMVALADQLDALNAEVTLMRGRLDRPFDEGPWRLVAAAILAWLIVPALVSLWVGLRWSRRGAPRDRGVVDVG